jgi:AsmA-like C-terminal region
VAENQPIAVVLQGGQIDLSAKLTEKSSGDRAIAPLATTPAWTLDVRFDRAILANGENAANPRLTASGDGGSVSLLDLAGLMGAGAGFSVKIGPQAGKRHLYVDARDAGAFLRGLDAVRTMRSGHLTIDANFEGRSGYSPLAGAAAIDNVVVTNSPLLGKLLQAITLYGLVDVLRGPGMTFSRVVVPFQYDGINLNIDQAHADNPSLGLTAKGWLGLSSGQTAISGTVVPAYFFNSMLGQLPLVGKLFSPETGGGVFAVRFALTGPVDTPSVSVNPVSALTPGFLREIFGIFDKTGTAAPAAR